MCPHYFEPPKVVLNSLNPEYDCCERLAEEVRAVSVARLDCRQHLGMPNVD